MTKKDGDKLRKMRDQLNEMADEYSYYSEDPQVDRSEGAAMKRIADDINDLLLGNMAKFKMFIFFDGL